MSSKIVVNESQKAKLWDALKNYLWHSMRHETEHDRVCNEINRLMILLEQQVGTVVDVKE